jgi:arylsulfatase A-like enzyme
MKHRLKVLSVVIAAMLTTSIFSAMITAPISSASSTKPEYLITIILDACIPMYLENADDIPNIRALMDDGLYFPNAWAGFLSASTVVANPVIHTGSYPKRFGIVEYDMRNPADNKLDAPLGDFLIKGYMKGWMENFNPPTISWWVKQHYPGAKTAAIGPKAHSVVPFEPHADIIVIENSKTIDNVAYVTAGYKRPIYLENEPRIPWGQRGTMDIDNWAMDVALVVLEQEMPHLRYMMINLPEIDTRGHAVGGENALHIMKPSIQNADAQIGKLVTKLKALGIYDKTLIVITADHGMMPMWRGSLTIENIWKPIRDAGIEVKRDVVSPENRENKPLGSGNVGIGGLAMATIWLENMLKAKDAAKALADNVTFRAAFPWIASIYYKEGLPLRTDLPERLRYRFVPLFGSTPVRDYLASTAACFEGPEVLAFFEDYVIQFDPAVAWLKVPGQHGGDQWRIQNVPIIFHGPGIPKGVTYYTAAYAGPRTMDIAPTALYLMGISGSSYGMDGRVLDEEINAAIAMAGEIPGLPGPAGPAGSAGQPGEPAPAGAVWVSVIGAIIAICVAAYALAGKRKIIR